MRVGRRAYQRAEVIDTERDAGAVGSKRLVVQLRAGGYEHAIEAAVAIKQLAGDLRHLVACKLMVERVLAVLLRRRGATVK